LLGAALAAPLVVVLAFTVLVSAADAGGDEKGRGKDDNGRGKVEKKRREVDKNRLKEQLEAELTERGLTLRRILPCRPQNGGRAFRCEWRASGTYPDGRPYNCGGYARYEVGPGSWRIDRCLNAELYQLLVERGLHVKAILNARVGDHVIKFEWRAEGVWPGDVPYRCKNVARYERDTGEWTLGPCATEITPAAPLLPQPAPHPTFGFNDSWTQPGALAQIGRATAIGAEVARYTIQWSGVEPSRDRYDWPVYDQVYANLVRHGVQPVLIVGYAPCWAQDNPRDCSLVGSPSGDEIDEYAEFAAAVARRYPKAFAIEVWNEPNWSHFWAPKPDPLRYSRMVRAAADAVHATGTGVPVILAGNAPLANDWENGKGMSFDGFLRRVYDEGGIGRAAAVSHHIYFGKVRDRVLTMRQQIGRLRAVMAAHGDGQLPLWITEVGLSSTEETDIDGQGPGLAQIYETLRRIENIPVVIVHRFFEGQDPLGPGIDHRGIIAADGDPKPAYCALAHAREVIPPGC
jgi:hypothetical protein